MRLEPMRYKEYTWPHNPETYTVEYRRCLAAHKVPFGGYCLQDLGNTYRVLRGEGVFAGEGAYEEFEKLETVLTRQGRGCWYTRCGRRPAPTLCRCPWRRSPCRTMCVTPLSSGKTRGEKQA